MAAEFTASGDALFDRADRAIAAAIAMRAEVRAKLMAAGEKRPRRPWAGDPRPVEPAPLGPMPPDPFLEQWWSTASTLNTALDVIQEADHELDAAWHRVAPTIQTPLALVRE